MQFLGRVHLNSVLEYNLAIKLNGKDTAEATIENLSAAAQFRQVTAADENAASYGALGLQSVADAENDSITPDLILGLSRDLAAVNTVVKQHRWADLNFAVEVAA